MTNLAELGPAFELLHVASRSGAAPDAATRRARLSQLAAMISKHTEAFVAAISADFGGRSPDETRMLEILPAMRAIRYARRHVARWMRDERRPVALVFQPARAWLRHQPLGVIGIISPWNYPLLLALAPLTDALAAGNRAMLKPSELTPRFSALLAQVVAETFAPDEVSVVIGGVEVAQAFSALPFDHLFFTGSTTVGRHVMRAAAQNLTPVTLELGGKSPALVTPEYPIEKAAASIAFGKFVNAGQTCIAPDYALVPQAEARRFAEALIAASERAYPTIAGNPDYTAVISAPHRQRLQAAIDEARAGGATLLGHGNPGSDPAKIAPIVVLDAPPDSLLMSEEIFGPVLPVIGYRDLDQALAFINSRPRPLALYCFSTDRQQRDQVLDGAISGGVTLNGTLMHVAQDGLPFGGIGPSGIGAYHGRDGFLRLSHARAVHSIGPVSVFERLGPPWGRLARIAGKWLSR
jgi:coniferyl-aldehyde dehydrogenase